MIGFWEILLVLVILIIIVGPKKLPELAEAIGKAVRAYKKALKEPEKKKKKKRRAKNLAG
jgi:sec-independent protein translocase protein TatA